MVHAEAQLSTTTKIVVCDDHPLFRAGVVSCFADRADLEVIAEATDGAACVTKLELFAPEIVIADLSMPIMDGFGVLEWLADNMPKTRAFILSMHTDLSYVQRARTLGAAGFLAKEDAQSELLAAIDHQGDFYTSSSLGKSASTANLSPIDETLRKALDHISNAEKRVLFLLTENLTSKQIAERLHISARTVQAHRVSLAHKLDIKGSNKLLELALRNAETIRKAIS